MKIKHAFAPITIHIETEEDLDRFIIMVNHAIAYEAQRQSRWTPDKPTPFSEGLEKLRKDLVK